MDDGWSRCICFPCGVLALCLLIFEEAKTNCWGRLVQIEQNSNPPPKQGFGLLWSRIEAVKKNADARRKYDRHQRAGLDQSCTLSSSAALPPPELIFGRSVGWSGWVRGTELLMRPLQASFDRQSSTKRPIGGVGLPRGTPDNSAPGVSLPQNHARRRPTDLAKRLLAPWFDA